MNPFIKFSFKLVLVAMIFSFMGCPDSVEEETPPPAPKVVIPNFNGDSAYAFVAKQVAFGPRLPNSEGHKACGKWLVNTFKSYGAKVYEQDFVATMYDKTKLQSKNIIASYNPNNKNRILLCAHWDTRHIADSPLATERKDEPILGADDGGSGVGVLLEVARLLGQDDSLDLGVDLILFDAEDLGAPSDVETGNYESWCLGSQYWAKKPHVANYNAKFGILLDMVGSKGARFTKEGLSMRYAPQIVEKVWSLATQLGYGGFFDPQQTGGITDDHKYVNEIRRIPTIDIINKSGQSYNFGAHWHTHNDNMDIIDKYTLKAVGQIMMNVIYKEDAGQF